MRISFWKMKPYWMRQDTVMSSCVIIALTKKMVESSGLWPMTESHLTQQNILIIRRSVFMLFLPIMMHPKTRKHWNLQKNCRYWLKANARMKSDIWRLSQRIFSQSPMKNCLKTVYLQKKQWIHCFMCLKHIQNFIVFPMMKKWENA